MASEEDNFDIDIYGDGGEDHHQNDNVQEATQSDFSAAEPVIRTSPSISATSIPSAQSVLTGIEASPTKPGEACSQDAAQKISSTGPSTSGWL